MTNTRTRNLLDLVAPSKTILGAAIRRLLDQGRTVELTGGIPGLFRVDGGAELTTNQLVKMSGVLSETAGTSAQNGRQK